jgi:hypothetical protein
MQVLDELLNSLTVGEPQVFEEVQVFPLFSNQKESATPFLQLDEALEQGLAEITEVSDGGSIPQLTVTNKSPRDIIIYDGQQLIGAKQNRIVNITVVVAANSTLPIPVSCVEQGRWRYTSPGFSSSDHFSYPSLRSSTHSEVTESMRGEHSSFNTNQSKVWQNISAKAARMDVFSDTGAMSDIYESQAPEPEVLNEAFKVAENQIGYMAFIKGGFAGSDVFTSAAVCRGKMEKLLRGYYLDSRDHGVTFEKVEIADILREVRAAEHREFDTVGKGRERRFDAPHVQGSWKEVDGFIPHVAILPKG